MHCAIILLGVGVAHLEKCDVIVVDDPDFFQVKKRSECTRSEFVLFYHFTRKFEDSERQYIWDNG